MQFLDFGTLVFIIAAGVIFYQLRSVLGKRTGNEKSPFDPFAGSRREKVDGATSEGNVITLPKRNAAGEKDYSAIDAATKPGTQANTSLRALKDLDPSFDPNGFIEGAKAAYEMIVTAFAAGDRKALKGLLSKDVFDGFVAAISEREMRGDKVLSSFVGISKAEIADVEMKGSEAQVTLKLVSQLISATVDKDGTLIEGDKEAVSDVKDVWTFARDTRSRDPNWKLVATEAED